MVATVTRWYEEPNVTELRDLLGMNAVNEAQQHVSRLVRPLDNAIMRGDMLATAVLESKLGVPYAERFIREA